MSLDLNRWQIEIDGTIYKWRAKYEITGTQVICACWAYFGKKRRFGVVVVPYVDNPDFIDIRTSAIEMSKRITLLNVNR